MPTIICWHLLFKKELKIEKIAVFQKMYYLCTIAVSKQSFLFKISCGQHGLNFFKDGTF
jgi:hypothetical protein